LLLGTGVHAAPYRQRAFHEGFRRGARQKERAKERHGPDSEAFRPKRWSDARPTWEFLPFGGGARHCPAQQLALFWIAYTVVTTALELGDIRSEEEVDEYVENLKLNMESHNGAKVSFERIRRD
jgi:cytochrome P450